MRCIVCDFCPDTDEGDNPFRTLRYSREEDAYICSDCDDWVTDSLSEFPEEDEDPFEYDDD